MMVSPRSSSGASRSTVAPTNAAGIISQTCRGGGERVDQFLQGVRRRGALGGEFVDGGRVDVVDDAFVAVDHQPPHHVRAHSAEPDHPQLHR